MNRDILSTGVKCVLMTWERRPGDDATARVAPSCRTQRMVILPLIPPLQDFYKGLEARGNFSFHAESVIHWELHPLRWNILHTSAPSNRKCVENFSSRRDNILPWFCFESYKLIRVSSKHDKEYLRHESAWIPLFSSSVSPRCHPRFVYLRQTHCWFLLALAVPISI